MKNNTTENAQKTEQRGVALNLLVRRLAEARENVKWTQLDLAKATGLQPAAISHFECGQRLPSLRNIVRLANALRVSLDWLTGRNDDPVHTHPHVEIDGVTYYPAPNAEGMARAALP